MNGVFIDTARRAGCTRALNARDSASTASSYLAPGKALAHELRKTGLTVAQQQGGSRTITTVSSADSTQSICLVEATMMVELKAVSALDGVHGAQCINYPKATGVPLCLLLNFGKSRIEVKRFVNGR
jgi:GxxExxY protein